jgi:small subunit ribosomal protein S20
VANIKSQKKRILTNEKARQRNKAVKSAVKTTVKRADEAVAAGDKTAAKDKAEAACKALDVAASKGVIHKNQASNRKSGLMGRFNGMEG